MIASLRGRLAYKSPQYLILDVGGVGYRVFVSLNTFYQLEEPGNEVNLLVRTVVREDAFHLYGFLHPGEQAVFEQLISVSGIGPRLAISILSRIKVEELAQAIAAGDLVKLTSVPGIGKKTAERLVVELKDKIQNLTTIDASAEAWQAPRDRDQEMLEALVNLGYNKATAQTALQTARRALGSEAPVEALLKEALRAASK